jgi:hypothetical protein
MIAIFVANADVVDATTSAATHIEIRMHFPQAFAAGAVAAS